MTGLRHAISLGPLVLAALVFMLSSAGQVPGVWPRALFSPDPAVLPQLLLHLAAFPRFLAALLAGAALALAGAILQRAFANPLAEPGTIGVLAGAQAALSVLLIWAPGWAIILRFPAALAGGLLAFGLVIALAARQGLSALSMILAGLVVTMVLGGLNATLALFHHDVLQSLFLWQAGALAQDGWQGVILLGAALLAGTVLVQLARRPLRVMDAGDDTARSLGLSPGRWRVALVTLAVGLAAVAVATVGAIGFIGILAPALLRRVGAGASGFWQTACTGAGLLALADQLVLRLPAGSGLQTGTLVALLGAVLMLALLGSLRPGPDESLSMPVDLPIWQPPRLALLFAGAVLLIAALTIGRSPDGWSLSLVSTLEWRLPRVLGAIAAGGAFGLAGCVMQRLLGNRMAGPELLGISGAASLGLVGAVLIWGMPGRTALYGATVAGAVAGLALITLIAARRKFGPRDLLLTGFGVSMLLSALLAGLLSSGHPMAGLLLAWLSGSTYRIAMTDAVLAVALLCLLLPVTWAMRRWLDILPMGSDAARALGVDVSRARTGLVLVAALATAAGTLLVGPLGLVGLLAPNIARSLAPARAASQVPASAACGAALILAADWLGRVLIFPWQIPAGLMSLVLGGAIFMSILWRKAR